MVVHAKGSIWNEDQLVAQLMTLTEHASIGDTVTSALVDSVVDTKLIAMASAQTNQEAVNGKHVNAIWRCFKH